MDWITLISGSTVFFKKNAVLFRTDNIKKSKGSLAVVKKSDFEKLKVLTLPTAIYNSIYVTLMWELKEKYVLLTLFWSISNCI